MRLKREFQLAADQENLGGNYHVISRVVWREFIFDEQAKVYFYSLMRKYERFCGLKIRAFCLMSNHFHMLVHVPPKPKKTLSDEVFFQTLELVYSPAVLESLRNIIQSIRTDPANLNNPKKIEQLVEKVKSPYLKRMWDLSEFMKLIKQCFTRWYNRTHNKSGTLWEGRFKSQLVQEGYAMKMVSAYIDLNPVRAGMVSDPKDYRWCSYGEAVAGGKRAKEGILAVMNPSQKNIKTKKSTHHLNSKKDKRKSKANLRKAMAEYRIILAEEGLAVDQEAPLQEGENAQQRYKKRHGFSREEAEAIIESGGKLNWHQLLRCKNRYFSEGLVIGSREYVNAFFQNLKKQSGNYQKRQTGARKLRFMNKNEPELYIMRNLSHI